MQKYSVCFHCWSINQKGSFRVCQNPSCKKNLTEPFWTEKELHKIRTEFLCVKCNSDDDIYRGEKNSLFCKFCDIQIPRTFYNSKIKYYYDKNLLGKGADKTETRKRARRLNQKNVSKDSKIIGFPGNEQEMSYTDIHPTDGQTFQANTKEEDRKPTYNFCCDLCGYVWQSSFIHTCPECDAPAYPTSLDIGSLKTMQSSKNYWVEYNRKEENKLMSVILIATVVALLILLLQ